MDEHYFYEAEGGQTVTFTQKICTYMTEVLCLLLHCRTSNDNDIYFVKQDESAVQTERNCATELKHKYILQYFLCI